MRYVNLYAGRISLALVLTLSSALAASAADGEGPSGTAVDNAYAAKLWAFMAANRLVGEGRVRSFPFAGSRPHGSIQEFIGTEAVIDGHRGRLLIKHNYGAKGELTPKGVYAAGPTKNSEPLAIMFQRKAGYDPEHNNWFWAEYNADGSVLTYEGKDLSGRVPLCTGCHTVLGGKDREVLNGSAQ